MPHNHKFLFLAGSARAESFNKKLANRAYQTATELDVEAQLIDLADYPMPLYDGDLENREGLPENAKKLKQLFIEHDGFLIASPEYNSSITPLLKNTLDWISRQEHKDEPPLQAYRGKTAQLLSASLGALGGMRALVVVRMMLGNIGVHVMPDQLCVSQAHKAFDETGQFSDNKQQSKLQKLIKDWTDATQKLHPH